MDDRASALRGPALWDLVWTLVRTDFKTRYHGTFGGYLWTLVKPLSMFIVLMIMFSVIFSVDPHYNLNLIIGLFLWDFFSESTKTGFTCLHAKTFLLTKAKLPPWVVVLTSVSNALITLTVFTVAVCSYIWIFEHRLSLVEISCFVFYLFLFAVIVVGVSLAGSVLFLRYRDLNQIWELVLQAGFFVAPVIYPLGILPERFHFYLYIWLPTAVIQFSRMVLVEGEIPTLAGHLMLTGSAVAVLLVGIAIFARFAPSSIERL